MLIKIKNKMEYNKTQLIKCPYCGKIEELGVDGSWKDFFRFDVEGNFWQLLFFGVKFGIIIYVLTYVIAFAFVNIFQEPKIINLLCN
jgi:hypothetical protein